MNADDVKTLLTVAEALSLLPDGDGDVHNFVQSGGVLFGCDFGRTSTLDTFGKAKSIELGGPGAMAMKHPLAVVDEDGRLSFFAADMGKVIAFEAKREVTN